MPVAFRVTARQVHYEDEICLTAQGRGCADSRSGEQERGRAEVLIQSPGTAIDPACRDEPVTNPGGGSKAEFNHRVCYPLRLDEGEAMPPTWGCKMTDTLIDRNPDILGGTPVFAGTRVPVRILMEHLEAGDRLDDFLVDYPTVSRSQAVALLERATTMLVSGSDEAAA